MLAEMAREQPRGCIVGAAGGKADDNRDLLALVERRALGSRRIRRSHDGCRDGEGPGNRHLSSKDQGVTRRAAIVTRIRHFGDQAAESAHRFADAEVTLDIPALHRHRWNTGTPRSSSSRSMISSVGQAGPSM